jgi:hypothetical protein
VIRLENWHRNHAEFLESRKRMPITWGHNDCVLFALDQVLAITGLDAAINIRGTYSTRIGAARRMRQLYGAADLCAASDAFAAIWNGEEVPVLRAGRGDLALYIGNDGPALAVCTGRHIAAPGDKGIVFLPVRSAVKAWRV